MTDSSDGPVPRSIVNRGAVDTTGKISRIIPQIVLGLLSLGRRDIALLLGSSPTTMQSVGRPTRSSSEHRGLVVLAGCMQAPDQFGIV